MITQNEILTHVYNKCTFDISGSVYKVIRPTDSDKEDCVLNVLSGGVTKFEQDGQLSVKLYSFDLFVNNSYYQDTSRTSEFESMLFDFSNELISDSFISFDVESREIYTEKLQDTNQHYTILKINFKKVL